MSDRFDGEGALSYRKWKRILLLTLLLTSAVLGFSKSLLVVVHQLGVFGGYHGVEAELKHVLHKDEEHLRFTLQVLYQLIGVRLSKLSDAPLGLTVVLIF